MVALQVLVGKGLDVLLDVYRKDGAELAATHAKLLQDLHDRPRTLRYGTHRQGVVSVASWPTKPHLCSVMHNTLSPRTTDEI